MAQVQDIPGGELFSECRVLQVVDLVLPLKDMD